MSGAGAGLAPQVARDGGAEVDAAWRSSGGVQERLARLAAAVGTLRRVQAALASRLIETGAPARLCYARLADYARERLGRSPRQVQELARVHRALARLPALERALVTNALPWSKVRCVSRVATPEDEATWIARAKAVPVRRLEQAVREAVQPHAGAGAAGDAASETEPGTRVTVRCTPAVCERWAVVHEVGERAAGRRLSAGDALELATAEALSGIALDPAAASLLEDEERAPRRAGRSPHDEGTRLGLVEPEDAEASPLQCGGAEGSYGVAFPAAEEAEPAPSPAAEQAEGLRAPARPRPRPPEIAALAEGLEEADAFELDRRLRRAIHLEQTLEARMAPLLRVVACSEYEWSGPWRPISTYAPEELGLSASKARALLRLERVGDACPELRAAYREGRLSWVKAQALLPLLGLDVEATGGRRWRPAWVAWAERVTVRRLEADVERALLLRAGAHLAFDRCLRHPERAQDPVPESERQTCAHDVGPDETQELVFRVPWEVASLFRAAREALRGRLRAGLRRLATDGEAFSALLDRALAAWLEREPGKRRPDPVIERDGYRCVVPGCSSRRSLQDHHVVFRSAGGSDAPANRVTLCAFHHQRGLHAGLLAIRGRAPDGLVFDLGLRPGAPPLVRYRSGDVALPVGEGAAKGLGRAA